MLIIGYGLNRKLSSCKRLHAPQCYVVGHGAFCSYMSARLDNRLSSCAGCPFAGRYEDELTMLHQYESKLANAVEHIFSPAYEYTRAYRDYKKAKRELYI